MNGKCDCCGVGEVVGVASSGLGAFSIAWCRDCLAEGVEPYWACVATTACCGGTIEDLADWARDVVIRSVAKAGKTIEEFLADVARSIAEEDAAMVLPSNDGNDHG